MEDVSTTPQQLTPQSTQQTTPPPAPPVQSTQAQPPQVTKSTVARTTIESASRRVVTTIMQNATGVIVGLVIALIAAFAYYHYFVHQNLHSTVMAAEGVELVHKMPAENDLGWFADWGFKRHDKTLKLKKVGDATQLYITDDKTGRIMQPNADGNKLITIKPPR